MASQCAQPLVFHRQGADDILARRLRAAVRGAVLVDAAYRMRY